jgi:hypothetical protein
MPMVRIQVSERVRYLKETELSQDDLDGLVATAANFNGHTHNAGDLFLDLTDIDDGEIDEDDISISVFENGKWKHLFG